MSRYVVGIDLGTTNSALAYADSTKSVGDGPGPVERLPIPQVVALNDVSERALLPSFLYLPATKEFPTGALELPWKSPPDRLAGSFAHDHGAKVPGRLVGSAKSWLSHQGVDRRSRHSALERARRCFQDLARGRVVRFPRAPSRNLERSYSRQGGRRAARESRSLPDGPRLVRPRRGELTIEAATKAGLKNVTLLEEPQAAFYAWLSHQGQKWRKKVKAGDIILVCDVGGGTTDFTLIAVKDEGGDLVLSRLAVGEHILLGGDNMDLALAYAVAGTLPKGMEGLDAAQRIGLLYACRGAKETLFSEPKKNAATVNVLGRGSKVVGSSVKTELTRDVLKTVILDGFLPTCSPTDLPERGRHTGLTEIGLPYAADAAITRHLARFLGQQAGSLHSIGQLVLPSAVLFNGGAFKAQELRRRVLEVLGSWSGRPVPELESSDLDLAVADGAAYYGQVRRGRCSNSRWRCAILLCRPRDGRAGGSRHSATNQGPLCRSHGNGGRHGNRRSRP